MSLDKLITKNDALKLLEIVDGCLHCKTEDDFLKLMDIFQGLIQAECSNCGWVEIKSVLYDEKVKASTFINRYPGEFLKLYYNKNYHKYDHVIQKYFKSFEIQNFNELYKNDINEPNPLRDLCCDFGINEGYAYGVCDRDYYSATAFFLAGRHVENSKRAVEIIKYLIPHLSVTLMRLLPPVLKNKKEIKLTPSETEVLKWIKEGKTTWEISLILNKSERGIKFHIGNILRKLNAMNRAHAVAIAMENKLIEL